MEMGEKWKNGENRKSEIKDVRKNIEYIEYMRIAT